MADVSPTRWHLAHTTWFFENFVLNSFKTNFEPFRPGYDYLFNSYYNTVGQQFPRSRRGLLTRPTVDEVFAYRRAIDEQLQDFVADCDAETFSQVAGVIELGLHHEQQHQELILTDIKHVFSCNPLYPAYQRAAPSRQTSAAPLDWLDYREPVAQVGHDGASFSFDNESPRHPILIPERELGSRLVTNAEYLEFVEDNAYRRPELWLSAGWTIISEEQWTAPLYWVSDGSDWFQFTLGGLQPLSGAEPVSHVSYFEADAFARWSGARLASEEEWEVAASGLAVEGNLAETGEFHPAPLQPDSSGLRQMFGDVWEWTSSPYTPYPGYFPPRGALGEYNGKFMCNQYVLRGGSCATSRSHIRATYRNFFSPEARWQFSGFRLAR